MKRNNKLKQNFTLPWGCCKLFVVTVLQKKKQNYFYPKRSKTSQNVHSFILDKANRKKKSSFAEKIAAYIMKKIEIKIVNVHLRYEDNSTNPKLPFSVGALLEELHFKVMLVNLIYWTYVLLEWKMKYIAQSITVFILRTDTPTMQVCERSIN